MARDVTFDQPCGERGEDEFNRWPVSERLAELIAGFEAADGAPVLGLFGKWGAGKSTVLNFVEWILKERYSERISVLRFNPWLFNDRDSLLASFFAELAGSMGLGAGKTGKQLGAWIKRYSGALGMVPVVGGGAAKLAEAVGEAMAADTVAGQRKGLIDEMRGAGRKVAVLIDDIDRLDRDEILLMLKLVRLTANFPNVVYLLAFDEERVARVAAEAYGEPLSADGAARGGREFLEKIVQYPFSLPEVSQTRLGAYVRKHAEAACAAAGITLNVEEWGAFERLWSVVMRGRMRTPRQAIRYGNALRFALPMLKGEANPLTQMLLEAMRILYPEGYNDLRHNISFISKKLHPALIQTSKVENEEKRSKF